MGIKELMTRGLLRKPVLKVPGEVLPSDTRTIVQQDAQSAQQAKQVHHHVHVQDHQHAQQDQHASHQHHQQHRDALQEPETKPAGTQAKQDHARSHHAHLHASPDRHHVQPVQPDQPDRLHDHLVAKGGEEHGQGEQGVREPYVAPAKEFFGISGISVGGSGDHGGGGAEGVGGGVTSGDGVGGEARDSGVRGFNLKRLKKGQTGMYISFRYIGNNTTKGRDTPPRKKLSVKRLVEKFEGMDPKGLCLATKTEYRFPPHSTFPANSHVQEECSGSPAKRQKRLHIGETHGSLLQLRRSSPASSTPSGTPSSTPPPSQPAHLSQAQGLVSLVTSRSEPGSNVKACVWDLERGPPLAGAMPEQAVGSDGQTLYPRGDQCHRLRQGGDLLHNPQGSLLHLHQQQRHLGYLFTPKSANLRLNLDHLAAQVLRWTWDPPRGPA